VAVADQHGERPPGAAPAHHDHQIKHGSCHGESLAPQEALYSPRVCRT
jgi:hypothetical protein